MSLRQLLHPALRSRSQLAYGPGRDVVAAIGADVDQAESLDWYADAMAELSGLPPPDRSGPAGGLYNNELFTEEPRRRERLPARDRPAPAAGRVRPVEVPAAELAVTVHHGPHDDIDVTYGELGSLGRRACPRASPGPCTRPTSSAPETPPTRPAWRTEIGWPVFRTA